MPNMNILGQKLKEVFTLRAKPTYRWTDGTDYFISDFFPKSVDLVIFNYALLSAGLNFNHPSWFHDETMVVLDSYCSVCSEYSQKMM